MHGKLSELHLDVALLSNRREKVLKGRKTSRRICPIVLLLFKTFSPLLENNYPLKWSSDSFSHMVTYMGCVENCRNYILTQSCLPIAGRLFYNVRNFHVPMVWKCNITFLIVFKMCFVIYQQSLPCYSTTRWMEIFYG